MTSTCSIPVEKTEFDDFLAYPWPWQDNGEHCSLASLQMILYKCGHLYSLSESLAGWIKDLEARPPGGKVSPEDMEKIRQNVDRAFDLIMPLAGADSLATDHADFLSLDLQSGSTLPLNAEMVRELSRLQRSIKLELLKRTFLYVPVPNNAQYDQERLFGDAVFEKFEGARADVKASGSALAVELYTACVFHLMRVAEYGLRAIANDRQVQLVTRGGNPYPIEMGTWEEVLRGLNTELEKVANWDRALGNIKVQALNFYSAAIEEIRAIKEWRNSTMHSRREFIQEDAEQIMAHVKRFMVGLSSRISETEQTPLVWTQAQLQ